MGNHENEVGLHEIKGGGSGWGVSELEGGANLIILCSEVVFVVVVGGGGGVAGIGIGGSHEEHHRR